MLSPELLWIISSHFKCKVWNNYRLTNTFNYTIPSYKDIKAREDCLWYCLLCSYLLCSCLLYSNPRYHNHNHNHNHYNHKIVDNFTMKYVCHTCYSHRVCLCGIIDKCGGNCLIDNTI